MLILCFGITKSGSTLAFELIKGMLESIGHPQNRLPDGPVKREHPVNFVEPVDRETLRDLLAAVGDRWLAVKSHSPIGDGTFVYLERLQEQGRVRVVVSYRDPRELCLSLMDAGVQARALGMKEFSEFNDLDFTARVVRRKFGHFRKWGALRGALRLDYDVVAFSPQNAIESLERHFGIRCDRKWAKEHAFERAFTQKNKAKRNRAIEEFSPELYEALTAAFADILDFVEDDSWYAARREEVLSLAKLERQKSRGPNKENRMSKQKRLR
jgi:hypothetical protein